MNTGQLDILNCGEGHMEIRFKEDDPIETARASRIIGDMLLRGYALFIEDADKKLTRVKKFVPERGVYIIADGPTIAPSLAEEEPTAETPEKPRRGRPPKVHREVPIHAAKTVAVGRSAGG